MPSFEPEKLCLLQTQSSTVSLSSSLSSSSSSSGLRFDECDDKDDDDANELIQSNCKDLEKGGKAKYYSKLSSAAPTKLIRMPSKKTFHTSKGNRHQIHRGARRYMRLFASVMFVSLFFVVLYMPIYSNVQTRQVPLLDWGFNTSRNISDYVLPNNDTNLLEPRNVCQSNDKPFLLIIVCSGLHNFAARQTIRETWANTTEFNYNMFEQLHAHLRGRYLEPSEDRLKFYSEYLGIDKNQTTIRGANIPVRVVFLVGRSKSFFDDQSINTRIYNESEQYQDIIQEDFIDTYNNLTLKSVMALKWVAHRCLNRCAFIMKCDDDTFVNVPNLLHYLLGGTLPLYNDTLDLYDKHTSKTLSPKNRLNKTRNYMAGYLFRSARPIAEISSKWYMPYYMYPEDKYPKYLSGAGYIMSIDVVPQLYETALNTTFIYLEDVYITGICADKIALERIHQPLFGYGRSKHLCSLKGTITQHEMKNDHLVEAFAFVTNITNRCAPPGRFFKHMPSFH